MIDTGLTGHFNSISVMFCLVMARKIDSRYLHAPCIHDTERLYPRNISFESANSLGYIGEFEEIDDHRSGKIVIQLNGRLNKCGVISPRFNIRLPDLEKWVNQLLPARSIGYVVLTTSAGIMDHEEARRKHVAGKILGFFY
jgi:small subunit ribosomal protein S15Ae